MILIKDILQNLNIHQQRAVLDESRAILVNANVGSGKTTVLIDKVLYQYVQRQVPLKDMVVLTFTNKAANEIKQRMMTADSQIKESDMPWFGTFHSIAMRMLQTILPVKSLGYTASFTILDPDDLFKMGTELIAENGFHIKYRNKLVKRLEAYQASQPLYGTMKYVDDIARLWDCMVQEKVRQNKMDFDDLIRTATQLLPSETWLPKWVIVDEFQDCNNLQLEFIRTMIAETTKVFVVGDPNQIIYSWRGSNRNIFTEFKKEYQAQELFLPINYRSSSTILAAAKNFLENQSNLEGTRETGCGIVVKNHYNPFQEADYLAEKIKRLHEWGIAYQNIAILYRLQRQSQSLEDMFGRIGIPYEVSVRKTLKDIPVLQWFVQLLNASVNENDRNSLIAVLTDVRFGVSLTVSQTKKIMTTGSGCELFEKIRKFSSWVFTGKTAKGIYDYFDLDKYLLPTSAAFEENRKCVFALLNRLEEYLEKKDLDLLPGLSAFINSASLYGVDILKEDISLAVDKVKFMTLHACKGLEFQYVFIIGLNYGLIPLHTTSGREQNQDQEEEEKRLFFVGITRARDCLELSYYTSPDDLRVVPGASSYLSMIPPHLLDFEETTFGTVDLQAFRRSAKANQDKDKKVDLFAAPQPKESSPKKVRHARYGEGIIASENEDIITVFFENYGLKTFSKTFCPLEFLKTKHP